MLQGLQLDCNIHGDQTILTKAYADARRFREQPRPKAAWKLQTKVLDAGSLTKVMIVVPLYIKKPKTIALRSLRPQQENRFVKIWHFGQAFLRTMVKLRQVRSNFWDFWPLGRRILFETTQILEPFWFLFLGRELYQVMAFYHFLDDLAAQVGPEKMHSVAERR